MKAIILALSLFFIVNHTHAKQPLEESYMPESGFEEFQENKFKVEGPKKADDQQLRNPSSEEKEAPKKDEDPKPEPWIY